MPAIYAHYSFGQEVITRLPDDLRRIVYNHRDAFEMGLQGPDILFFYRPYSGNSISKFGYRLHDYPARYFFCRGAGLVRRHKAPNSAQYAYLLGFVCHFTLDSECHPYIARMIEKTGVSHIAIEAELDKYLQDLDGHDPVGYKLSQLVHTHVAAAIAPFLPVKKKSIREALYWQKLIQALFVAPCPIKRKVLDFVLHLLGKDDYQAMIHRPEDEPKCLETNDVLSTFLVKSVPLAVRLIKELDECVQHRTQLSERFNRNFG
ncbi:MAG: zinc dependent phospholipase C family protein [Firmicutes bacterium]|nr:zinc dependent phospholipase C family protein [Bacillota bacterium]